MYKKIVSSIAVSLVVFAYPAAVFAQTEEVSQTVEATSVEERAEKQAERIAEYKAKVEEKLTAAKSKKIAGVCKTSQQRLEKVQAQVEQTAVKRQEKLDSIVAKLKTLSTRLQASSVDTTELDALITTLEQKITDFMANYELYQQAIEDTTAIDCETDPEGFKASLDAARAERAKLKESSTEIKQYVRESIKSLLDQIKSSLEQTTSESEE